MTESAHHVLGDNPTDGRAKLTATEVREIRAARRAKNLGLKLAARYGVSPSTISRIRSGKQQGGLNGTSDSRR